MAFAVIVFKYASTWIIGESGPTLLSTCGGSIVFVFELSTRSKAAGSSNFSFSVVRNGILYPSHAAASSLV